jgi:hypothetical protein
MYELFKNLNSALDHDDVELRMFSESLPKTHDILTCIKKSKNDKASGNAMVRN